MGGGAPLQGPGFNEGKGKALTADDVRYTAKDGTLYVIAMGWPTKTLKLKSIGTDAKLLDGEIKSITLLGSNEKLKWSQAADALSIEPAEKQPCKDTFVFKITTGQ